MATHVNAYKEEVAEALSKAHDALSEAEKKVDALIEKYEESETPGTPAETPQASSAAKPPKETPPKAQDSTLVSGTVSTGSTETPKATPSK